MNRLIFGLINQSYKKFDYLEPWEKEGQRLRRELTLTRWVPWARRPAAADEGESTSVKQHNTVSDLTSSSCYTEYVFERFSSPHNKWHIPSNFIEMLRNGSLNAYCLPGSVTHDEFTHQHQVYQLLHYRPFALKKRGGGMPRGCQLPSLQLSKS